MTIIYQSIWRHIQSFETSCLAVGRNPWNVGRGCWPVAMPLPTEENTEQKHELFVTNVIPLHYPIIGARVDHD